MLYRAVHHLWRCLPQARRQAFFYGLTRRLAPHPGADPGLAAAAAGPVTVGGLLSTTTGLGEGARLCLKALQSLGYDTRAADVSAAFDQADLPGGPDVTVPPPLAGEGGSLIAHINGPYLPFAFWRMGRAAVRGRRVIGYWAWELPTLPDNWRTGLPFVHEVWAPSRFTADAVAALTHGKIPVRVVPHPLPPPPSTQASPASLSRADFALPEDAFVVMAFFHMGSSFTRKNPLAAVRAFRTAFGDDPKKILLLKVVDAGVAPWARRQLEQAVAGAGNIRIIERRFTGDEMTALLGLADAVMSLHRAEGFGLVPAQAMQLGKPVVATGWSGNLDFMNADNSLLVDVKLVPAEDPQGTYAYAAQRWADPDPDHAAALLRRLAENSDFAHRLGAQAAADAARSFGLDTYAAAIAPGLMPAAGRIAHTRSSR